MSASDSQRLCPERSSSFRRVKGADTPCMDEAMLAVAAPSKVNVVEDSPGCSVLAAPTAPPSRLLRTGSVNKSQRSLTTAAHAQPSQQNDSLPLLVDPPFRVQGPTGGLHAPSGQPSQKQWKACASPRARRASAVALMVLSEDERAELDDCFHALAGSAGVISQRQIAKAMELVLGQEDSSEKVVKAAFETMGPNVSGQVDRARFRAYMMNNWNTSSLPAADSAPTTARRRSAENCDFGNMRLSDIIRMYRSKTLAERTLKKAQQQVHTVLNQAHDGLGDGGAKTGAGSSSKEAPARFTRRSADSLILRQPALEANVPLARFRRASMFMLEAALAAQRQPAAISSTENIAAAEDVSSGECYPQELDNVPDVRKNAPEFADAHVHLTWDLQMPPRYGRKRAQKQQEYSAEVDAGDHPFAPLQPLSLAARPLSPQPPLMPRRPRDPLAEMCEDSCRSFKLESPYQDTSEAACSHAENSNAHALCSTVSAPAAASSWAAARNSVVHATSLPVTNSPPRAREDRRQPAGGMSSSPAAAALFDGLSSNDHSDGDGSGSSSGGEDDPAGGGRQPIGRVTSWVTKRLTRFMPKREDSLSPDAPARSCTLQRNNSLKSSAGMRSASFQHDPLRGHSASNVADLDLRQSAMPRPGGAGVEKMFRRMGSQRGVLPSLAPGAQPGQAGAQAYSAAGSRTAPQLPSHLASLEAVKAKTSFFGMIRMDKPVVDVHRLMNPKVLKKQDRWKDV